MADSEIKKMGSARSQSSWQSSAALKVKNKTAYQPRLGRRQVLKALSNDKHNYGRETAFMESKAAELVIQTLQVVRAHWQCSVSHRLRSYIHLVHSALLALMLLIAVL